ncbi:MAG TPA: ATP-binding protein, partial [Clostridia bacterium]|nr:ATP-binding protein [Clostridia bacterium]
RVIGGAAAFIVLLIGSLTLSEHLFQYDLGIDQLLATEPAGALGTTSPNRMGVPGSATMVFVGMGLLGLAWKLRSFVSFSGLAACLIQLFPAVGYVYAISPFYSMPHISAIAWPSVVALLSLGAGLVFVPSHSGPVALFLRKDAGGMLLRRIFPALLLIPLGLGFLEVLGRNRGLYDTAIGTGLLVIGLIVVSSSLLWKSAAYLSRLAAAQNEAEEKIRHQNAVLEGINRIFREALTCNTEEALGRTCLEVAEEVSGSKFGFIAEINPKGRLEDIAISNPGWEACKMANPVGHRMVPTGLEVHGLYGRVLLDGKGFFTNAPSAHPDSIGAPEGHPKLKAFLGVPLIHHGKTIGIVGVGNREGGYRQEDLEAMNALAPAIVQVFLRQRAEQALRESEHFVRRVLNNLFAFVGVTTPDGTLIEANRAPLEAAGIPASEVLGKKFWDCYWWNYSPEVQTKLRDACERASRGEVVRYDVPVRMAENSLMWIDFQIAPLRDSEGHITHLIPSAMNIEERKQAEEALRQAKEELARVNAGLERKVQERTAKLQELVGELEHFSYTITHDMRAPLRAMKCFGEMASELCAPDQNEELNTYLRRIITAADRMDALVIDALSYSKAVRQDLVLEPVDARALLHGMLDTYPEFQTSRADIRVEGEIPLVMGNEAGLTQCFSNLLGNAVKFAKPDQTPRVRIWAEARGAMVRLWFEDNGIGIPKSFQPRVFEMFSRGHRSYDGTGIGLALVRKVAERMGGNVGVEAEEGQGSRFWLDLRPGDVRESGAPQSQS